MTDNLNITSKIDHGAHDWNDHGPLGTRERIDPKTGKHVSEASTGVGHFGEVPDVVRNSGDTYNAFTVTVFPRSGQVPASSIAAVPVEVIGVDVERSKTILINSGTQPVVIGTRGQVAAGQGFQLNPGIVFNPSNTAAIYACCLDGATVSVPLSCWIERGNA